MWKMLKNHADWKLNFWQVVVEIQLLSKLYKRFLNKSVKGLQSYRLSNFENDSNPGRVDPRPNVLEHTSDVMAETEDFLGGPPNLTASNFAAL